MHTWFKVGDSHFDFFLHDSTQDVHAAVDSNMRLVQFLHGRFEACDMLPPRTRSDASTVEKAIRSFANEKGDICNISIHIGKEYIPICHVDEARVVSRMLTADHDCFTEHFYEKGFEPLEDNKAVMPATHPDAYYDNEVWKLEYEYELNEDLGTPSFGSAKAHDENVF